MGTCFASRDQKKLPYLLALWRIPGLGPKEFVNCLQSVDAVSDLFEQPNNLPETLMRYRALITGLKSPDWQGVERDMAWLSKRQAHLLTVDCPEYPLRLKEISCSPPILFVKGQLEALNSVQLAVVGSRKATQAGKTLAHQWSRALAGSGITITSGLALGIDGAAHRGALEAGCTVAVVAHGLHQLYPKEHIGLANEIVQAGGAVISEFPIGVSPLKHHFPRRNRLISGLSTGTLVIEAAVRSGSLVTAKYALEQNREVFAVPGSVQNPLSKGPHALIKQGAKLVDSIDDILQELLMSVGPARLVS